MNYPIPTHLKSIFKVIKDGTETSNFLQGELICECGCEYFSIFHNENRGFDNTLKYSEQDGLKVVAVCKECKKKHLVFDEATQGYYGFVCSECKTASVDSLTQLLCNNCDSSVFSIILDLEIEDKDQFIEECVNEFLERFSPDDYINAFNWIVISICCKKCNKQEEWINLELS